MRSFVNRDLKSWGIMVDWTQIFENPYLRHKIWMYNVHDELQKIVALRMHNDGLDRVLRELDEFHDTLAKPNYVGTPPTCRSFDWLTFSKDGRLRPLWSKVWKPWQKATRKNIFADIRHSFEREGGWERVILKRASRHRIDPVLAFGQGASHYLDHLDLDHPWTSAAASV